jgi:hypothetical protein
MEPPAVDKLMTRAAINESRREALMRFGRYAAIAPATMLLLEPKGALAKKRGKKKPKGRKKDFHY